VCVFVLCHCDTYVHVFELNELFNTFLFVWIDFYIYSMCIQYVIFFNFHLQNIAIFVCCSNITYVNSDTLLH
jgi:hypothetical protein